MAKQVPQQLRAMPSQGNPKKGFAPLLAGAGAGMAESFITYPTEYVKTISQLSARSSSGIKLRPTDVIRSTLNEKGLSGFYRGCGPVVAGNALKAGTRFLTYETIRDLLRGGEHGTLSPMKNVLAGVGAGCIESIVAVTPSEAIKTRLIEHQRGGVAVSGGSMAVIGTTIRTEGFLSLYRGLVPTMMKQSANSAVRFTSYQTLKEFVAARSGGQVGNLQIMGIGAVAGVITVYATMPFDVVKTRMQQAGIRYTSSIDCFTRSLKAEGVSVFWRGSSPRVARLVVSGTVTFVIYENILKVLQRIS